MKTQTNLKLLSMIMAGIFLLISVTGCGPEDRPRPSQAQDESQTMSASIFLVPGSDQYFFTSKSCQDDDKLYIKFLGVDENSHKAKVAVNNVERTITIDDNWHDVANVGGFYVQGILSKSDLLYTTPDGQPVWALTFIWYLDEYKSQNDVYPSCQ